jgi:hypothetical protein
MRATVNIIDKSIDLDYWSYGNMINWSDKHLYCNGKSQSPIDLIFNRSRYDRRLRPIHLHEETSSKQDEQLANKSFDRSMSIHSCLDAGQLINNGYTGSHNRS